jgi:hypothetical protein
VCSIPETESNILQINGRLKFSSKEKNQHFLSGLKDPLMMENLHFRFMNIGWGGVALHGNRKSNSKYYIESTYAFYDLLAF